MVNRAGNRTTNGTERTNQQNYPQNLAVENVILKNFKILRNDPETKHTFPLPPLISPKRGKNIGNFLVRSARQGMIKLTLMESHTDRCELNHAKAYCSLVARNLWTLVCSTPVLALHRVLHSTRNVNLPLYFVLEWLAEAHRAVKMHQFLPTSVSNSQVLWAIVVVS